MKKSISRNRAFLAVFVLLGTVASINAATMFTIPDPMYVVYMRPVGESYVVIWIGNFENGYQPENVDPSSIIVNSSLAPASVEVANHDFFGGNALKVSVAIDEFLSPYGFIWGTTEENYTVDGSFNDDAPFSIPGMFTYIGHVEGDVNRDGTANISDLNFMVNDFFRGGPSPEILATGDVDGSCGAPNMRDLNYMVNFIFRGGPTPTHCTN